MCAVFNAMQLPSDNRGLFERIHASCIWHSLQWRQLSDGTCIALKTGAHKKFFAPYIPFASDE